MVLAEPTPGAGVEPLTFIRGDADGDGDVDADDLSLIYGLIELDYGEPGCEDRYDVDDNGELNEADWDYIVNWLDGGPAPPAPFPSEGEDPTVDSLPCTR